jgi:hypothetical protein
VLGRLVDLWWHRTHPEFESAADQVQAHAVVWLGTVILLLGAGRAVTAGERNRGFHLIFGGAVLDVMVSAWHFWEHYHHRDPALPHILLVAANVLIFTGAAWLVLSELKRRRQRAAS